MWGNTRKSNQPFRSCGAAASNIQGSLAARGNVCTSQRRPRSRTSTRYPASDSRHAVTAPPNPLPMMTASKSLIRSSVSEGADLTAVDFPQLAEKHRAEASHRLGALRHRPFEAEGEQLVEQEIFETDHDDAARIDGAGGAVGNPPCQDARVQRRRLRP